MSEQLHDNYSEDADARMSSEGVIESDEAEKSPVSLVLMTGTQMERPLRHLAGLVEERLNGQCKLSILNLGTKTGVYEHEEGGYPPELRQEIIEFVRSEKPAVLGVTLIDYGLDRLAELLEEIAVDPGIQANGTKIVVGGPFAVEHRERAINLPGVDMVNYATGWHFADLVEAINGGADASDIPGLLLKRGVDAETGAALYDQTALPNLRENISGQPLPYESHKNSYQIYKGRLVSTENSGGALPVEHHQVPHRHTGVLITSQGCPNDCEFCSIPTQFKVLVDSAREEGVSEPYKVKFMRPDEAVALIENYIAYNPKTEYVLFNDNDFAARSLKQVQEFCRLYKERINMPFYCQVSPNTISPEKIAALVDAGMDTLDTGVQGSEDANRSAGYERSCTNEQVLQMAEASAMYLEYRTDEGEVVSSGLKVAFDFINGNPVHTREDMLSTMRLIDEITKTITDKSEGRGGWNLAIHNLTLDQDRELAQRYRQLKEPEEGDVSKTEASDYHNAEIDAFYATKDPYLNIVLQWMGGLHDSAHAGCLPKRTADLIALIAPVVEGNDELQKLVEEYVGSYTLTKDFLTSAPVCAYFDRPEHRDVLKAIHKVLPPTVYSYQRPDRHDYDYSWAEEQIVGRT